MNDVMRVLALIVGLVGSSALAGNSTARALTQNGVQLPMPDIDRLDCAERSALLNEYLISAYRGIDPLPEDHPDRWIFEYENRLAQSHFMECAKAAVSSPPKIDFSGSGKL